MSLCRRWYSGTYPIRAGISQEQSYIQVTRRFAPLRHCSLATGHQFERPDEIRLVIQPSIAGRLPVLIFASRQDFEYAWLSLTNRNEPKPLLATVGAAMIAGYNNVERIRYHKSRFLAQNNAIDWPLELKKLLANKSAYRDQLVLISPGPYSGVTASELGLGRNRVATAVGGNSHAP